MLRVFHALAVTIQSIKLISNYFNFDTLFYFIIIKAGVSKSTLPLTVLHCCLLMVKITYPLLSENEIVSPSRDMPLLTFISQTFQQNFTSLQSFFFISPEYSFLISPLFFFNFTPKLHPVPLSGGGGG